MKIFYLTLITFSAILIACGTSKKNTSSIATVTSNSAPTPAAASIPPASNNFNMVAKSPDGIYVPGNEELIAIQAQYKDVTLDELNQGHAIYTQGACIRCHSAQNIYIHGETEWKEIMDDMAQKAVLNDAQKNAVYKYVLSIKAASSKQAK